MLRRRELEALEQLLLAFTKKHLRSSASESRATRSRRYRPLGTAKPPLPEPRHDAAPLRMQVQHQTSPNFGIPLRKFVGG